MTSMHEKWIRSALILAERARKEGEIPVGAVVVMDDEIIGSGYNQTEHKNDPTAHAEILALRSASGRLGFQRLSGCSLYVTLEPCPMCSGALVLSRIDRLVFGAKDPKSGACGSLYNLVQDKRLNHRLKVTSGILEQECSQLLKSFFRSIRENR